MCKLAKSKVPLLCYHVSNTRSVFSIQTLCNLFINDDFAVVIISRIKKKNLEEKYLLMNGFSKTGRRLPTRDLDKNTWIQNIYC